MIDLLRVMVALVLAGGVALLVCRRRGADAPPGFAAVWRWAAAFALLTLFLWVGVFLTATTADLPQGVDTASLDRTQLLVSPLLLLGTAGLWTLLAYGTGPRAWSALGLSVARPLRELGIGALVGIGVWAAVLAFMLVLGLLLLLLGGGELPAGAQTPAPLIVWLAGLPVAWRLGLSLAAAVSEEIFFRGLLQSRLGIALSTIIFVLGHLVYGVPLMLVGIALLSVTYAVIVRLRGNVVSAIAAHAVFDAVQLLIVIPAALAAYEAAAGNATTAAAVGISFCYAGG